jgi:hypothetical protein
LHHKTPTDPDLPEPKNIALGNLSVFYYTKNLVPQDFVPEKTSQKIFTTQKLTQLSNCENDSVGLFWLRRSSKDLFRNGKFFKTAFLETRAAPGFKMVLKILGLKKINSDGASRFLKTTVFF